MSQPPTFYQILLLWANLDCSSFCFFSVHDFPAGYSVFSATCQRLHLQERGSKWLSKRVSNVSAIFF